MRARVKQDGPKWPVRACGGEEFVKNEWRAVPVGREDEAANNPFLEVEPVDGVVGETGAGDTPIPPAPDPQPEPGPEKPKRGGRRTKAAESDE